MAQQGIKERKEIAIEAYRDPVFFNHYFLSDWFPDKVPWVHRGILAILTKKWDFLHDYGELEKIVSHFVFDRGDGEECIFDYTKNARGLIEIQGINIGKIVELVMPRGFSKTTITNSNNLYDLYYQDHQFFVNISETASHAATQLTNCKNQIEGNELFQNIFGSIRPDQRQGFKWTEDWIETMTPEGKLGAVMAARGRGGQIRGMNRNAIRPSKILLDDVEDQESVKTPDQRVKTREWFYKAVLPALPRRNPNAGVVAMGTLLHMESLLMVMQRDPRVLTVKFGAVDKDGEALWKEHMSLDQLEEEKEGAAATGTLNAFYMEYMSELRNDEEAKFHQEYFHYEMPEDLSDIYTAVALDPAISDKVDADFSAICVAGMHIKTGKIFILDFWMKRGASPREQLDMFFKFQRKWKCQKAGIESIAFQAALIHIAREEMFRKGQYFEVEPITHSQKKTERVEGILQPRYASGYIVHSRPYPELEGQLLDWPNGKLDGPDVEAMAIALLDPYAAAAADPEVDLADDEFDAPIVLRSAP